MIAYTEEKTNHDRGEMMNSDPSTLNVFADSGSFDWEKAKIFYYVAKLGSFTHAGDFLQVSSPVVNHCIRSLEYQLGHRLLIQLSHGVDLTRKGHELLFMMEQTFMGLKNHPSFRNKSFGKDQTAFKRSQRLPLENPCAYRSF